MLLTPLVEVTNTLKLKMPYYFKSCSCDAAPEGYILYMGKDKAENEELIKFAWPEDVWFHVDKESSAHVYIRLARYTDCTLLKKSKSFSSKLYVALISSRTSSH